MNTTDGQLIGVAQVLNKTNGVFEQQDEVAELPAAHAVAMRRSRLIENRVESRRSAAI